MNLRLRLALRRLLGVGLALVLLACSGTAPRFKPAELAPDPKLVGVRLAWTAQVGAIEFPMYARANGSLLTVASSDGQVVTIDAAAGKELWRAKVSGPLGAGVGSDGRLVALLTRGNELLALQDGREIWREKLSAQGFTAPLVAGGRVFVLTADRGVAAFDGGSGRKLWSQQRPGEALVLRQAGVLLAVGDTLVAGLGGRLVGMNPGNGSTRWDVAIATPRGTNDVERLVDLVAGVSRVGDVVCARAFQAAVGCADAAKGALLWSKAANGSVGLHGDERSVFGVESDGRVLAWRRADGQVAWVAEHLRYRAMSAPLAVGRSVVVGDESGLLHWLSREDGTPLTRMPTDGSEIVGGPVLAGGTLVVVTRKGGVFGFKPD